MPKDSSNENNNLDITRELSFDEKMALIERLLTCTSIKDPETLKTIINNLPDDINQTRFESNQLNVKVTNLLDACLNHQNGLQKLLRALHLYERNSIQYQKLQKYVEETLGIKILFTEIPFDFNSYIIQKPTTYQIQLIGLKLLSIKNYQELEKVFKELNFEAKDKSPLEAIFNFLEVNLPRKSWERFLEIVSSDEENNLEWQRFLRFLENLASNKPNS